MIPRVIHFIWISAGEHPTEEQLFGIKTAQLNTTCHIILHTDDPTVHIPGIEIRRRTFPTEIRGTKFNPDNTLITAGMGRRVSHLKDIVRLEILYKEGGVYSDLDVIWLRNPWEYWDKKIVIGFTNKGYKILANAIMMSEPGNKAILQYRDWLVSIYPEKRYWIPANPYKLWAGNPDVTMVDKYVFYPVAWKNNKDLSFEDIKKSVAVHQFRSMGGTDKGEVVKALQVNFKRYMNKNKKTRSAKKSQKSNKRTRRNK